MKNIDEIKARLIKDKDLNSNLDLLINYSLANKTLIFNLNSPGIEFELLLHSQILKLNKDKYQITDFFSFGFKLYSQFKKKHKSKLTSDFKTYIRIINDIEEAYSTDKVLRNVTNLLQEIWAIAIIDANQSRNITFSDYLNSLNIEDHRNEIYSFNEGYSRALIYLKIDSAKFVYNGTKLINWIKSDVEFNIPLRNLLNSVRNKIFANIEWGLKCFDRTINQQQLDIDFLIPIITGLYEGIGIAFYYEYLEDMVYNASFAVAIICGLSNIDNVNDEECKLFFKVYETANKNDTQILLNLPKLLFAILRLKRARKNSKHIKKAFENLNGLLETGNPNLIVYILREIVYLSNFLELRKDLINRFIQSPHFKDEYLNLIDNFLFKIEDIGYFETVLYELGEKFPFKPITRNISSTLNELMSNHKNEFDRVLVNLFIQDKARFRFLATEIIRNKSLGYYTFDYDILKLRPVDQYKLWVSVFQYYREPKFIIPCLLPLLNSNSILVQEALICKLEEYTESFGGLVTKILNEKLDLSNPRLEEIYNRIEAYRENYYQNSIKIKEGIKELNPIFSQNKLFVEFNNLYNRRFSRQIQKSTDESSILNLFSKVTLLKGGGWKIGEQEEISKLGKISTSFSLPRLYFINPENFDFESTKEMSTDWDENTFGEIKVFLEHE